MQVAGAEARMVALLRRQGEVRQRAMLRERLQALALEAIVSSTANLGTGLTLLVAAAAMREGTFSVGDPVLFATYLLQVAEYTGFLGYLVVTLRQSGVSFRRAQALLGGAPAERLMEHHPVYLHSDVPAPPFPAKEEGDRLEQLVVRGLTYLHPETGRGIDDVGFSLRRGTLTVITGRIGSGKTTLLRALLGLLPLQVGDIFWNGMRVERPAEFMTPPRVAYTAQVPTLLSGRLRDSILLGLETDDTQLQRALELAVLETEVQTFPAGLETPIGDRGGATFRRAASARGCRPDVRARRETALRGRPLLDPRRND